MNRIETPIIERLSGEIRRMERLLAGTAAIKLHPGVSRAKPMAIGPFRNLWLWNEGLNPTGTHKDYLAIASLRIYLRYFLAHQGEDGWADRIPAMSIISAGNAAVSIGNALRMAGLPRLRVLVDHGMSEAGEDILRSYGCSIFRTDLASKPLTPQEILAMTENPDGIEITSFTGREEVSSSYQGLAHKILATGAKCIIVPYGTGTLFGAILASLWKSFDEMYLLRHPKTENGRRYKGQRIIGVTAPDKDSLAKKLFCPFAPFETNTRLLQVCIQLGLVDGGTGIQVVEDAYIEEALAEMERAGIQAEASGAAGLAYFIKHMGEMDTEMKYMIISTGKGVSDHTLYGYGRAGMARQHLEAGEK